MTDEDIRGRTVPADSARRLLTARLLLRPLESGDAAGIAMLANDRQIAVMLGRLPHPYRLDHAEAFIADPGDEAVFAVTRRPDPAPVGIVGLRPAKGGRSAELGYWIGRPFWGKGYAPEAAQAVIDYGFTVLRLEAVTVSCRVVNEPSRRVIRKCGFHYCGTGMLDSLVAGTVATERYIMDRGAWLSLKMWGSQ